MKTKSMQKKALPGLKQRKLTNRSNEVAPLKPSHLEALVKFTGSRSSVSSERILNQVANAMTYPRINQEEALVKSAAMIMEMAPKNGTEALLAAQMIATHDAALKFMNCATVDNQTPDGIDASVNRASRLMRIFTEQIEAMQKLKGMTGQQKVTVEHVHVHEGGQAIVGNVAGKGGRGCKE